MAMTGGEVEQSTTVSHTATAPMGGGCCCSNAGVRTSSELHFHHACSLTLPVCVCVCSVRRRGSKTLNLPSCFQTDKQFKKRSEKQFLSHVLTNGTVYCSYTSQVLSCGIAVMIFFSLMVASCNALHRSCCSRCRPRQWRELRAWGSAQINGICIRSISDELL